MSKYQLQDEQDDLREYKLTKELFGEDDISEAIIEEKKDSIPEKAVWEDEEDTISSYNISKSNYNDLLKREEGEREITASEYNKRLRQNYDKTHPLSRFIKKQKVDESEFSKMSRDAEMEVFESDRNLLNSNKISISRLNNIQSSTHESCVVRSLKFHKNGQLLLSSGYDKRLKLFQIDGVTNPLFQSIFFNKYPIYCSDFINNYSNVLLSGKRAFLYIFDLSTLKSTLLPKFKDSDEKEFPFFVVNKKVDLTALPGARGKIYLLDNHNHIITNTLFSTSGVTGLSWYDENILYSTSNSGEILIYDLRNTKYIIRCVDEGALHTTSIDVSTTGLCATGSDSGVVNVYENLHKSPQLKPKPIKSFLNLTTKITGVKFNIFGNILGIHSHVLKDQLRLINVTHQTVFKNWPTNKSPLNFVECIEFSPNSGYITIGTSKGQILLYKINHFTQS